jgi:predicted peroxiredoxin
MDVMGVKKEDLIDGLQIGGAATFLAFASENAITLSF